jgi:hypothetical protein
VRLAFALRVADRGNIQVVLLRRYRECPGRKSRYKETLAMPRVVWETVDARASTRPVYQCVQLDAVNRLVVMQRDPTNETSEEAFFCNTLVPMHYSEEVKGLGLAD